MQQVPDISFLSDEEKLWFAKAIAGMVVAAGREDSTEVEVVKVAIGFTRREDAATIMSIIKQNQIPPLGVSKVESKASFTMLKFLAEIMVVDHKLSESEVLFFNQVGKLLVVAGRFSSYEGSIAGSRLRMSCMAGSGEVGPSSRKTGGTGAAHKGWTRRPRPRTRSDQKAPLPGWIFLCQGEFTPPGLLPPTSPAGPCQAAPAIHDTTP